MAEGLFTLILFSIVMAVASFAAGMLPLAVSLSQSQLRLMSTIGMGVLVGTSLIVIIPEGIETLYSVKPASTRHMGKAHGAGVNVGMRFLLRARTAEVDVGPATAQVLEGTEADTRDVVEISIPATVKTRDDDEDEYDHDHEPTGDGDDHVPPSADKEHDHDHEHEDESSPHAWVGLSLISGFILMYLIDQIPKHTSSGSSSPYHIAIDNLNELRSYSSSGPSSPNGSPPDLAARKSLSTTTGLVIHAAADGIALGASSTSSNMALEAIIFLAIMLHKAPAAFGLSAVLLRAGLSKRQARHHLIVFSLAAPVGALATWIIISVLGSATVDRSGMQWWTGVLLLFSGGTFLYVAMHTMQEDDASHSHSHSHGGDRDGGPYRKQQMTVRDTVAAVFGMLLPLATQIGHHHH